MKLLRLFDVLLFIFCLAGGLFVLLNYSDVPAFVFGSFWLVLILSYLRILDYESFFIVREKETRDGVGKEYE